VFTKAKLRIVMICLTLGGPIGCRSRMMEPTRNKTLGEMNLDAQEVWKINGEPRKIASLEKIGIKHTVFKVTVDDDFEIKGQGDRNVVARVSFGQIDQETYNKGLSQNKLDISGIDCVVPFSVEIAT
jgi:hypothetical protein